MLLQVCLTCPITREAAEAQVAKFPHLLEIKEALYADIGPGEFTAMPAFWPHEVACLDKLCLSISSGRNVPELEVFKLDAVQIRPFLDAVWDMDFREQLMYTQAFYVVAAHRLLRDSGVRGCKKEATCLKTVVRRALDNFYAPMGVLKDAEVAALPCPPLKAVVHKLSNSKQRAKLMEVMGEHVDRVTSAWDSAVLQSPARYGHFARWLVDQLDTRLHWFEGPLFMHHCLS